MEKVMVVLVVVGILIFSYFYFKKQYAKEEILRKENAIKMRNELSNYYANSIAGLNLVIAGNGIDKNSDAVFSEVTRNINIPSDKNVRYYGKSE